MHMDFKPIPAGSTERGFTLVETLVTITLLGLLLMMAVPAFVNQLRAWQRDSVTTAFTAHVRMARSEAIKSSRRVVMCSSSNGSSCAQSDDWSTGWLVFVDADADGAVDEGENILAIRAAATGLQRMATSGSVKSLSFMPNGLMASSATKVTVIPTGSKELRQNEITINRIGRTFVTATAQKA